MKLFKYISVILLSVLCCCSCGLVKEANTYTDRLDEIQKITIVELLEYDSDTYTYSEKQLREVLDVNVFMDEMLALKCDSNWGDPQQLQIGDVVIKLVYDNGDFDLINWRAQIKRRSGTNRYGYMIFDEKEFDLLLSKYLNE